jgi:hypothetical protein
MDVSEATVADRRVAALAHLGVPCWGPVLPLIVWAVSSGRPFRRAHASQAFSFQSVFIVGWAVLTGLVMGGVVGGGVPLVVLTIAFAVELPQVARGLGGKPPRRLVPFEVLAV